MAHLRMFGLRFLFVYALLYGSAVAAGLVPMLEALSVAYMEAWLPVVNWTGRHLLGLEQDIEYRMTGSGDTSFDWVLLVTFVGLAALVALAWSVIARRSPARIELAPLVRSLVRHLVASNMLAYGAIKVFSSQFGDVEPQMLVRTFGEMSPMALLWSFMAYSDVYETFGGLAEMAGGVLLLFRRTTTLGALVTIGVMSNVVVLNYCYDVPVKLLSTQLLLAAFWLVAPDVRRLLDVFVRGRGVAPLELEPWPRTVRARRAAMALKLAFIGGQATGLAAYFVDEQRSKGEPRDPLLGVYEVESFLRDGEELPALLGDARRWRRVGIYEWALVLQPMTDALEFRRVEHDPATRTLTITPPQTEELGTPLVYSTNDDGTLELHGMDGEHRIDARLRRVDPNDFLLMNRGFHWVNEVPFNR
jgi:hypothetical protein